MSATPLRTAISFVAIPSICPNPKETDNLVGHSTSSRVRTTFDWHCPRQTAGRRSVCDFLSSIWS